MKKIQTMTSSKKKSVLNYTNLIRLRYFLVPSSNTKKAMPKLNPNSIIGYIEHCSNKATTLLWWKRGNESCCLIDKQT